MTCPRVKRSIRIDTALVGGGWRHNILRPHNAAILPMPDELPAAKNDVVHQHQHFRGSSSSLQFLVANIISLRKHLERLIALDADVMLVAEVQLTEQMIKPLQDHLHKRGMSLIAAVPAGNQGHQNVTKFGGTAILTKHSHCPCGTHGS